MEVKVKGRAVKIHELNTRHAQHGELRKPACLRFSFVPSQGFSLLAGGVRIVNMTIVRTDTY